MGWQDKGEPFDGGRRFSGRKRRRGGGLRHIRTTQERRAWDRDLGRLKRSPKRLPDYYDEAMRHWARQDTWKLHRATQYRGTP